MKNKILKTFLGLGNVKSLFKNTTIKANISQAGSLSILGGSQHLFINQFVKNDSQESFNIVFDDKITEGINVIKSDVFKLENNKIHCIGIDEIVDCSIFDGEPEDAIFLEKNILNDIFTASKFTGNDELREVMMNVFIDSENIVSTDAWRLFKKKHEIEIKQDYFLSQYFIKMLKLSKNGVIFNRENHIYLIDDNFIYVEKTTECKYPNYKAVFSETCENYFTLDRKKTLGFINKIKTIKSNVLFIGLNTELQSIEYSNEDLSIGLIENDVIVCDCEHIIVSFNFKFLESILKEFKSDNVVFKYSSPNKPVIVDDNFLLCPVFINS